MQNEIKLGLHDGGRVSEAPILQDAAFRLPPVTAHRASISTVVEKAGALRRTTTSPDEGTRDWKPTVTAPGVEAQVQQKAGAGDLPAGARDRWSGPDRAPVIVPRGTNCPSTRASASADRMTPTARMQTSSRNPLRIGELYPARAPVRALADVVMGFLRWADARSAEWPRCR